MYVDVTESNETNNISHSDRAISYTPNVYIIIYDNAIDICIVSVGKNYFPLKNRPTMLYLSILTNLYC